MSCENDIFEMAKSEWKHWWKIIQKCITTIAMMMPCWIISVLMFPIWLSFCAIRDPWLICQTVLYSLIAREARVQRVNSGLYCNCKFCTASQTDWMVTTEHVPSAGLENSIFNFSVWILTHQSRADPCVIGGEGKTNLSSPVHSDFSHYSSNAIPRTSSIHDLLEYQVASKQQLAPQMAMAVTKKISSTGKIRKFVLFFVILSLDKYENRWNIQERMKEMFSLLSFHMCYILNIHIWNIAVRHGIQFFLKKYIDTSKFF